MQAFAIKARVYYEDTDAGGIVYHANYLKYTERARTEWVRAAGFSQQVLLEQKLAFVITKLKANFKKSAKLDDEITITCIPNCVRKVSLSFYQQVFNQNNELLFELEGQIAFVSTDSHKLLPIPLPLKELATAQIEQLNSQHLEVSY